MRENIHENYTKTKEGPQLHRGPLHNFGLTRRHFKPRLNNHVENRDLYYEIEEYVSQLHNSNINSTFTLIALQRQKC